MNHRELVRSYLDAFATGKAEVVAEHVSDDFQNIQVGVLGSGCQGKDTYQQRLKSFLADFADLKYHVETLIVDGDDVAAAYRMTFDQNEQSFDIQGVMIITIRDGRIAIRRDYWDGLEYQRQSAP